MAVGLAYLVGYRRLAARRHSDVGPRRAAFFAAGYLTLVVALISPLHAVGEEVFSVHMVQHLLLTLAAPPLLLLANAMPAVLWAFRRRERVTLGRMVGQDGPIRRTLRFLTHPAIAWTLFVCCQWGWHQPPAYELALVSPWVHYAEHLSFFGAGMLFWWPVIGAAPLRSPLSYPARILYTFTAWIPNSILGAGLALSPSPLFRYYVERAPATGVDPLSDEILAGLIMWIPGDLLFLGILLVLVVAFFNNEERQAERIDRELDALEAAQRGSAADRLVYPS